MGFWRQRLLTQPTRIVVCGFAAAILSGALLLTLPLSSSGSRIGLLDALFTATSAVCVTGLTVRDTAKEFSPFGHAVILALIQLGGLGITTLSTALFVLFGQRASLSTRDLVESSFLARPEGRFRSLLVQVLLWTFSIEALGAVLLLPGELGRSPPLEAVWSAAFHAVSAFCNAGFSLRSDSLMGDRTDPAVILPISGLVILGGLGFAVLTELGGSLRAWAGGRRAKRLSLHARTALSTTGLLLAAGTLGVWTFESGNLLRDAGPVDRFLTSFFASVTARTAGFNSVDYSRITEATAFLTIGLMSIGGCPGSTAGGVKATTLAVLFAAARRRLSGRRWPRLFDRGVPDAVVDRAVGVVALVTVLIFGGVLLLAAVELGHVAQAPTGGPSLGLLFEVVSALGTVGLTAGVTPGLGAGGKLVVIGLMFVGRLGPLTVATAVARRRPGAAVRLAEEPIMIG